MDAADRLWLSNSTGAGNGEINGRPARLAVLVSGGLDSAVLVAEAAAACQAVYPLYVRCGLRWEAEELAHLEQFLAAVATPALKPLQVLDVPTRDVYGDHWSLGGAEVPDALSPDEAVFLPGRNILLLSKAMILAHRLSIPAIALGSLSGNPFSDATPDFLDAFQRLMNEALGSQVRVLRPYARLAKLDVLRRGQHLPLEFSFSCLAPVAGIHCGACNKCAERRRAFAAAGLPDRTRYAASVDPIAAAGRAQPDAAAPSADAG